MKTNISSLMAIIAEEERYLNNLICNIKEYAINTSVEELDGRVNIIVDNKEDFDFNFQEIEKTTEKLSKLKATLYEKNNLFKLSDGRSIQQAIVDNTNLRKVKFLYEQLLLSKNSKRRVTEVNNSYFECKVVNFDAKDLKERLLKLDEEIQNTDFEISKLNSLEFDI